jgi:hypothetical protein
MTDHDPVGFHDVDSGCRLRGDLSGCLGDRSPQLGLIVILAGLC